MAELDAEASKHRTLDIALAKLPYNLVDLPERYAETFRRAGARTAYMFRDKKLAPIMYRPNKDADFASHATGWEMLHSTLVHGDGGGKAFPVVDQAGMIIGHFGAFNSFSIFVPNASAGTLQDIIEKSDAFVDAQPGHRRPTPTEQEAGEESAWRARTTGYTAKGYQPFGKPQSTISVVTDVDGGVVLVLGSRDKDGIVPVAYSPLDLIAIPRLLLLAGRVAAKKIVLTLARRRAAKAAAAAGAAREIATLTSEAPLVLRQARKVTPADMLKWEREGGHALQNHGPHLTRQKLKERVLGREVDMPPPQIQPGGVKPADLRVWRGDKAAAASKWSTDENMRRAIGEVVEKNLDQIRRTTQAGGEVILEKQALAYKTGEGWVTAADKSIPAAERAIFYNDNLKGVTIVIRPRKGHIPSVGDPEGWYVHTAFPDIGL